MEDPRDEIKRRVDIVELIGEYLTLKPSGTHSHKAICPFHAEKSPSLHVSGDRQIFHCFGCGEGGDCFSFVMKMEGMDFPEALRHLGAKVGVEVKRVSSEVSQRSSRLIETNELAQKFFRKVLVDFPAAASVRDYASKRGIPEPLAEKFGLGYAPDAWDSLATVFAKRGFTERDGIEAGLLMKRKSGQGCIDRFRDRLMVPLRDQHGHTVGFTGRVLPGKKEDGPKYMNSPETPVYHKGRLLFGLDMAKTAAKREGNIVIVEGNLDVIASHKAGVENVVASSGTALTSDQLDLLKRYTATLVFSFDQDAAGFEAARKGIALARGKGFDVRAAVLPREAGKDPDEAVQKDPELWRRATAKTVPIMQFMIERVTGGKDLSNVDEKRKAAKLLLPEISAIADAVEREHYLSVLADLLRTDLAVLRGSLPKVFDLTGSGVTMKNVSGPGPARVEAPNPPNASKMNSASVILLGIAAGFPKERASVLSRLTQEFFASGPERELYSLLRQAYDRLQSESPGDETQFFGKLRGDLSAAGHSTLLSLLDRAVASAEDWASALPDSLQGELLRLIDTRKKAERDARRQTLLAEIRLAERNGEREAVERLLRAYHELLS